MIKLKKWWMTVALAALVVVGCSNDEQTVQQDNETVEEQIQEQGAFPITLTDALGAEITVQEQPNKIISLIPSNTEILFALGLNEEIIGVSGLDNYPEEATTKEVVGDMTFDIEKIISLQPDIVFAHESGMYSLGDGLAQLQSAGIAVFVVKNAATFEETYETVEQVGLLTGKTEQAAQVIANTKQQIENIQHKLEGAEPKTAFVVVGTDPDIYVAGKETFIDEMLQAIDVQNVVQEAGWLQYSAEQFAASDATTILVTYESDIENIINNAAFSEMPAVKNSAVEVVDGDTTSRQGPRLADGIESIAQAMYPEVFGE
jgi:iron complex transport system substrate-binding protein